GAHPTGPDAPAVGCPSTLAAAPPHRHAELVDTMRTGGGRPRRLLLAADRSAASRAALLAVAGFVLGGQTEVVVLDVDHGAHPGEGRRLVDDAAFGLIALAVDARSELRRAPRDRLA